MTLRNQRNVANYKMLPKTASKSVSTTAQFTKIIKKVIVKLNSQAVTGIGTSCPQRVRHLHLHLHVTSPFQQQFIHFILWLILTLSHITATFGTALPLPPTTAATAATTSTTSTTSAGTTAYAAVDNAAVIGATSLVAAAAAIAADMPIPHSGIDADADADVGIGIGVGVGVGVGGSGGNSNSNSNSNNGGIKISVHSSKIKLNDSNRELTATNKNNGHREMIANSANLLLENLQHPTGHIVNLTRHYDGDVFQTDGVASCNPDTCVGLSSGTAGLVHMGSLIGDLHAHVPSMSMSVSAGNANVGQRYGMKNRNRNIQGRDTTSNGGESCQCRCLPYLSTYREDLGICVDDIHECTLSPFVSGSSSEKIPFVFLPLRGQIIYPSREISFADIRTPVCAVTGAQFLTTNGWSDLRNPIDSDYPFRMFRDEGRTFLQWLGEADLRHKMQGRLIVVHLVCRDMTIALNTTTKEQLQPLNNVFSPCVAFRVNGSPVKYSHNVSEVLFQSETTATLASTNEGMTTKEYVVIGVCSLLLGLIYVSSVFLYLHMKKRKNRDQRHMRNSLDDLANEINYPKNDQVTFGAPFNRSGSLYSATSLGTSNEPRSRASIGSLKEEMGIVKNNPLLQHFPQLSDHHSGFASDISNSNSECEMDNGTGLGLGLGMGMGMSMGNGVGFHDKMKQLQTSALVHPQLQLNKNVPSNNSLHGPTNNVSAGNLTGDVIESSASSAGETECIPQENVAIVEDMMTEEKLENLRAMVNGNVRKKLYFNPAYFEPHMLADPPPAAIEFLQKIREVIAIAKYKMATKRYQPSLIMIPEENSLKSNSTSMYGTQAQNSSECQACLTNRCSGHVKNCGDKRNSIEKWLETVSATDRDKTSDNEKPLATDTNANTNTNTNKDTVNASKQQQQTVYSTNDLKRTCAPSTLSTISTSSPSSGKQIAGSSSNNRCSPPRKEISPPKQLPPPPPQSASHHNSKDSKEGSQPQSVQTHETTKKSIIEITQSQTSNNSNKVYQHYTATSVKVPINRNSNYETFSSLTAAANIYGFAETGSEIYNNPKFILHDSPAASQRSRSSSQHSKSARKRLDTSALDQYAAASTPTSLTSAEREHYEHLRQMKQLPDGIFDGIKHQRQDYNATLSTTGSFHLDIPTPDYDSTMEKKIKDIYNNTQSSCPSVPTPDYSSLSRKSLKQYQPDSPIYRRKSPQYLIVDYETDSLERLETTKRKSSHSSSSPSSDVSSQMSPSLSTALPLEEELEISHTVYNKLDGFRKDADLKQKLLNNTASRAVDKQKEIAARIKYDTPFRGSMTIEVEHEPQSDLERSTDSDQFEPDTLDRKPKKQSFCDALSEQLKRSKHPTVQQSDYDDYLQSTNMSSLPDMSRLPSTGFRLNQNSSFRSQRDRERERERSPTYETHVELRMKHYRDGFGSLNELPQTNYIRDNCKCGVNAAREYEKYETLSEQGRILTLEAKQKRRQRLLEPVNISPPPVVEITKISSSTKTTIKISTPKVSRADTMRVEPQIRSESVLPPAKPSRQATGVNSNNNNLNYDFSKRDNKIDVMSNDLIDKPGNTIDSKRSMRSSLPPHPPHSHSHPHPPPPPLPPPPPPPNSTASMTLTSQHSTISSRHYQNQSQYMHTPTEDETISNHSEGTEFTGISDTVANSEVGESRNNTLSNEPTYKSTTKATDTLERQKDYQLESAEHGRALETEREKLSPELTKKFINDERAYSGMFNTQINGLRNDYSLTKYLNRRKTQDVNDEQNNTCNEADSQRETNNNNNNNNNNYTNKLNELPDRLDVISISSRSNRSSSRLSDRTKELYRNAGVPVGIAYPQRSATNATNNSSSTNTVQAVQAVQAMQPVQAVHTTVYRCEIEPVQLTHGMQIAMGLKDRAKKAKDLKNAWKKFVSLAASKFSPTQSPAPPFEKKTPSFLESLDRDEGISSLIIDEHTEIAATQSSYSAPASQNYYEQRFGGTRTQEMDSGYMSADSGEVYKRSFYDRYNFKSMTGRDHIIRVDTIEDNSDAGTSSNVEGRFEDFEHMGDPPPSEVEPISIDNVSDADAESVKTLTQNDGSDNNRRHESYSSEDERGNSPSYGSSETEGETNVEDMWESGAESIETHSVLYKNVKRNK